MVIDVSRVRIETGTEKSAKVASSKAEAKKEAKWEAQKGRNATRVSRWCWFVEKNKMVTLSLKGLPIYGKCGNNHAGATRRRR